VQEVYVHGVSTRKVDEILQRAMAGEITPQTIRVSRPMLEETNGGRTDVGPMIARLASARDYEGQSDVFSGGNRWRRSLAVLLCI